MKPWIIAVAVGAVLLLVGVPALAVALSNGDQPGNTTTRSAEHRAHHHAAQAHGPGHGYGTWKKLTPQQRREIADRLDTRAGQLRKLATCLRGDKDVSVCRSLSRPRPRG